MITSPSRSARANWCCASRRCSSAARRRRRRPETLKFGDLLIDPPRHLVSWRGKPIELTATEFKLLVMLAQRRGRVQSRDQLLRDVWEYNSLDRHPHRGYAHAPPAREAWAGGPTSRYRARRRLSLRGSCAVSPGFPHAMLWPILTALALAALVALHLWWRGRCAARAGKPRGAKSKP